MESSASNKIFGNAFNLIPQIGPITLLRLLSHFGNFHDAWFADGSEYERAGIKPKPIEQIIANKTKINPEQSFAELARRKIEVLTLADAAYPQLLKEISSPPPVLYVRGQTHVLRQAGIAVVGTRKVTPYGQQATAELVLGIIQNNLSVISGLAFGIDAAALSACVEQSGTAIAVLASDLDDNSISPRQNFRLSQAVLQQGCLVSEYPLGFQTQKQNFPIRNRIIAGLALGTLVIEADQDSGSLITAKFALEQNREVFAVPGSIFSPVSRGTNQLIKQGAKLVTDVQDILDELAIVPHSPLPQIIESVSTEEQAVLDLLSAEPMHLDEIVRQLRQPAGQIAARLTVLEMRGRIKNLSGSRYVKTR